MMWQATTGLLTPEAPSRFMAMYDAERSQDWPAPPAAEEVLDTEEDDGIGLCSWETGEQATRSYVLAAGENGVVGKPVATEMKWPNGNPCR